MSHVVIRVRFKENKIYLCEGRASLVGIPGEKDPHPRAIQLSLSQILSVEQSQQGGVMGS